MHDEYNNRLHGTYITFIFHLTNVLALRLVCSQLKINDLNIYSIVLWLFVE